VPRRKTADPVLIRLRDQETAARERFEKLYSRLKRTFNALEKTRRAVVRLQRRIEKHLTTAPNKGE
jgi:hypothetical protein